MVQPRHQPRLQGLVQWCWVLVLVVLVLVLVLVVLGRSAGGAGAGGGGAVLCGRVAWHARIKLKGLGHCVWPMPRP